MALTFAQIFGEWVKRERERSDRKWTQKELGRRAGIRNQGNVSEVENAQKNLTHDRMMQILRAFEMDAISMIVALPQLAHEMYEAERGKAAVSIKDGTLSPRAAARAKEVSAKVQERGGEARRRKRERGE